MNSKKSAANDLFLLMLNLTQMAKKETVIEVFIGALKAIWPNIKVKHIISQQKSENNLIQISYAEDKYDYLRIDNLVELDDEDESLLNNACGMLAVVLKKLEQELLLSDEKLLLQESVKEHTQHLSKEIEERKKIEKELTKSEEKYHSLFKNINVGVALHEIIVNKDGKPIDFVFLDLNPTYEKLTTLKKDDIVGKRGLEVIPNLEQKWIDLYGEVALTRKPISITDHSDFLDKYWDVKAYSPNKNQFAVAITDITEKVKADQEIIKTKEEAQESEEKFRLLHENAGLGIGYYEPDGTIISFNSIAANDMNGQPEDFKGKSIFDIFPKESADFYFERIQKSIKDNEIQTYEDSVQLPSQIKWFLSTYTKIVNPRKEILGIQIISQNITEIKQFEIELRKAKQKAEESDRLKSAFLANMSHEIRTPMNGILGFSGLLKEPKLSGEQQQKYIGIIEKSGARMLNIINDIVDISKIEAGLMTLDIKESDINEQIEYIYTFFKPEVEAKGMKLSFKNTLPSKDAIIKTDREKVFAILTNLVKNAIKYTNKGSIEFGYNKKGNFIEFFVEDTGIGISKNRQEAIFERFIQADIEDVQARQGAGLGLSISKAYVEMLGGKIWVESEEGNLPARKVGGSTFYFTIPYNAPSKEETRHDTIDVSADSLNLNLNLNLKILIVEDDETSSDLLSIIVDKYGKEIISVANGNNALEACLNNPDIDLIMMDIQLPGMNGYEVTRQIREFNKEVIIIAQTAYGLSGDREKALDAGCNDYISKPINKDEFDALMRKYFRK